MKPFITECVVCGTEYRDGVGSTPCCGAIQTVKFYHVEVVLPLKKDAAIVEWISKNPDEAVKILQAKTWRAIPLKGEVIQYCEIRKEIPPIE